DERELPRRRGLLGNDAIAAAMEVQVMDDVAGLVDAGESRAQFEVHVAQEGMLGDANTNTGRGRVTRTDLDIDVAHRRIEGIRIGIPDLRIERHHRGGWEGDARHLDAAN